MENQHRQISGYRELSQEEIDLMNEVKSKGVELGELVGRVKALPGTDGRWASIAATDLQTGLMALLELARVANGAPRNVPISQMGWWSRFGTQFVILAEAVSDASKTIDRLEKEVAELKGSRA